MVNSLLATLALAAGTVTALPAVSSIPRGEADAAVDGKGPTCHEASTKIKDWTITDFDFHASYIFTNPAHQNSWGYTNFTLANAALDYTQICTAASSQLQDFFYGTMVYQCESPDGTDAASFTFSRPSGELRVNQTWNCPEAGSRWMAEGGVVLDLDCKEEKWENPDWELGQFYSTRTITCEPVTEKAPIETISAVM